MARVKSRSPLPAIVILFTVFALLTAGLLVVLDRFTLARTATRADRTEQALRQILARSDATVHDFEPVLQNADGLVFGSVLDAESRPFLAWESRDFRVSDLLEKLPKLARYVSRFRSGTLGTGPQKQTIDGYVPRFFRTPEYRVLLVFRSPQPVLPVVLMMLFLFVFAAAAILLKSVPVRTETRNRNPNVSAPQPPAVSVPERRERSDPSRTSEFEKLSFFREVALATNALTDLSSMLKTLCGVFAAKFPERNIVFFLNAGSSDDLLRPVTGLIGGRSAIAADLVRAGYEETDMDTAWSLCEDRSDPEHIRVPLKDEDTLYGFILLEARDPGEELPDVEEINFVSRQVALAVRNSALYREAITDGLTGLFVHRYFQMKLEEEIRRFRRTKRPFSIFLMDIDNFKRFNDNFGHQAGDFVLRELAAIVRASVRASDLSFRYGGEELSVIFPETILEEGLAAAEKIRTAIAEHEFVYENDTRLKVTVSGGIAVSMEGLSGRQIVESCDRALYKAKAEGKNRIIKAEPVS